MFDILRLFSKAVKQCTNSPSLIFPQYLHRWNAQRCAIWNKSVTQHVYSPSFNNASAQLPRVFTLKISHVTLERKSEAHCRSADSLRLLKGYWVKCRHSKNDNFGLHALLNFPTKSSALFFHPLIIKESSIMKIKVQSSWLWCSWVIHKKRSFVYKLISGTSNLTLPISRCAMCSPTFRFHSLLSLRLHHNSTLSDRFRSSSTSHGMEECNRCVRNMLIVLLAFNDAR